MPEPTEEAIEAAKELGTRAGKDLGPDVAPGLSDEEAREVILAGLTQYVNNLGLWNQGPDGNSPTAAQPANHGGDNGSEDAKSDPVDLRHGEFGYRATDVEILGSHTFSLARTYRNRVNFFQGPFGQSTWDHNFNARVFERSSDDRTALLCESEVQVSLGDLRVIRMRPVVGNGEPGSVYRPLFSDEDMNLSRRSAATCAWELTTPDKHQYCFDDEGRVQTIRAVKGESVAVTWETAWAATDFTVDRGVVSWEAERVKSVLRTLDGADTHRLDFAYRNDSLLETVAVEVVGDRPHTLEVITYDYDDSRQLQRVSDEVYDRDSYEYSDPMESASVVPLEGLEEFCTSACAMNQDASCGGETLCAKVDRECPGACADGCARACDEAYEGYWDLMLQRPDLEKEAARWNAASNYLMEYLWAHGAQDNPWVPLDLLLALYDKWAAEHGTEFDKESFARFVYAVPGENFLKSCNAACQDECLPSCSGQTCGSQCLDVCMGSATDADRYVYGQPSDLAANLTKVTDGSGVRVVENEYGTNPALPSFDAVVVQYTGGRAQPQTFAYADFSPPAKPHVDQSVEASGGAIYSDDLSVVTDGTSVVALQSAAAAIVEFKPDPKSVVCLPKAGPEESAPPPRVAGSYVRLSRGIFARIQSLEDAWQERVERGGSLGSGRSQLRLFEVQGDGTLFARRGSAPPMLMVERGGATAVYFREGDRRLVSAEPVDLPTGQVVVLGANLSSVESFFTSPKYSLLGTVDSLQALTSGRCGRSFSIVGRDDSVQTAPAGACRGQFQMVPLVSFGDRQGRPDVVVAQTGESGVGAISSDQVSAEDWGLAQRLVTSGQLDLFGSEIVSRIAVPTQFLSVSDVEVAFRSLISMGRNASPVLQTRIERSIAELRLGTLLSSLEGNKLELRSLHAGFEDVVAQLLPSVVALWSAEAPELSNLCKSLPSYEPGRVSQPRDQATARWATYVRDPDGESLVSYYSEFGDNLRVVDVSRGVIDDFEWDTQHNKVGAMRSTASGEQIGPSLCLKVDRRHLPIVLTQSAAPQWDPPDQSTDIRQCVSWSEHGPWVNGVSTPVTLDEGLSVHTWRTPTWLLELHRDARGNVHLVRDEAGNETRYLYDRLGRPTRRRDPNGALTSYTDYDPGIGLPRNVTVDAEGEQRTTSYTYDDWGHRTSETRTGWGVDRTWQWKDRIRLAMSSTSTETSLVSQTYQYAENGWLEQVISPTLVTEFEYGSDRQVSQTTTWSVADPLDRRIECESRYFDGTPKTTTDALGVLFSTARTYEETETVFTTRATAAVDPHCATPPAGADPVGADFVSMLRYDGGGRLIHRTDARGVAERFEYDGFGRAEGIVDGTGARLHARLDERGRVVRAALLPPGASVPDSLVALNQVPDALQYLAVTYDDANQRIRQAGWVRDQFGDLVPATETAISLDVPERTLTRLQNSDAGAFSVKDRFDALGRLVDSTSNTGDETRVEYTDSLTAVVSTKGPGGATVESTWHYDRAGRLRRVADSEGVITREIHYDAVGQLEFERDEAGVTNFELDDYGRVRSVERRASPASGVLESSGYVFDDRGRLDHVSSGGRNVASYEYDLLGRVVRELREAATPGEEPLAQHTRYLGTSAVVVASKLPSGRSFSYGYDDPRGLLTSIIADAGQVQDVSGAARVGAEFERGVTGGIERASVFEGASLRDVVIRVFDGAGRVVGEESAVAPELAVSTEYGSGGAVSHRTIAGTGITPTYRPDGRLANLSHDGARQLLGLEYSGAGAPSSVTFGDSLTDTRTFDPRGRVTSQDLGGVNYGYGYGTDGAMRRISTTISGEDRSMLVGLDAASRVTREVLGVAGVADLELGELGNSAIDSFAATFDAAKFEYDISGNWLAVTAANGVWRPEANDANAYQTDYLGGGLEHDVDGRLTRMDDDGQTFRYNAFGQLARVEGGDGENCTYRYDAYGRRTYENCNDQETRFGWDGDNLVVEQDIATQNVAVTIHAGGLNTPVARINAATGEVFHLVQGATGNVQAAFDAAGNLVETYSYSAFGETEVVVQEGRSPTGNRLAFHGHVYDPVTGLYNMRARYYSPSYGRFITQDPIGVAGGANLYAFARNSPLDFWDPYGLDASPQNASMVYRAAPACVADASCENWAWYKRVGLSMVYGIQPSGDAGEGGAPSLNPLTASAETAWNVTNPFKLLPPGLGGYLKRTMGFGDDALRATANVGGKGTGALDSVATAATGGLDDAAGAVATRTSNAVAKSLTPSSKVLGEALEAAGTARPAQTAAHHLVAGSAKTAGPARAALDRFGIGINDAANGVFLPANRLSANAFDAAVHSTVHTRTYYGAVNALLGQATTRAEALGALQIIRNSLLGGGFP